MFEGLRTVITKGEKEDRVGGQGDPNENIIYHNIRHPTPPSRHLVPLSHLSPLPACCSLPITRLPDHRFFPDGDLSNPAGKVKPNRTDAGLTKSPGQLTSRSRYHPIIRPRVRGSPGDATPEPHCRSARDEERKHLGPALVGVRYVHTAAPKHQIGSTDSPPLQHKQTDHIQTYATRQSVHCS